MSDYGKILICRYLPPGLIPEDLDNADFDEFFQLLAMAEIARDLQIEDIKAGIIRWYNAVHQDS